MGPRLDENSYAVKLLREKFESFEIGPKIDASTVWALEPLFAEYKLETFRTRLNRLKKVYLGHDGKHFTIFINKYIYLVYWLCCVFNIRLTSPKAPMHGVFNGSRYERFTGR